MASSAGDIAERFDPAAYSTFRFTARELDADGRVRLHYGLDDGLAFTEELQLPVPSSLSEETIDRAAPLLQLLHWVAGVSYYKTAAPPAVSCETGPPGRASAALLEALYSEGLGEFAFTNGLDAPPRPRFTAVGSPVPGGTAAGAEPAPRRVLVPVGGGKDSIVALEIVRRSGCETTLFSIGDAPPIARTVAVAGLPRLLATRRLDAGMLALNGAGALNGHIPVTAIVTVAALLTASLNGLDTVAMANERSASSGNVVWEGIEVNHQFSKSLRAERLLSAALSETDPSVRAFSVLRPASELTIARAFARMPEYHAAFTSCNAIFRLDPQLRAASWCGDCPKCRFVFLILAPFSDPGHLAEIFGADLLDDPAQADGFALLTATGGHKPFECVGEEDESVAALRMLAADPRWSGHAVVARLAGEVLGSLPASQGDPAPALALSDDHDVPAAILAEVRALLGS